MKSKEWEEICLVRMRQEEERGNATMGRYGVQGSFMKGKPMPEMNSYVDRIEAVYCEPTGETLRMVLQELIEAAAVSRDSAKLLKSLPDFEGVLSPRGRQFVTDCKVVSGASLEVRDSHFAERQITHMMRRSRCGAICFVLIFFNERVLKTRTDQEETWAFPVWESHPFWLSVAAEETKSISRDACVRWGVCVEWNTLEGGRKMRPDILQAIYIVESIFDKMTGRRS